MRTWRTLGPLTLGLFIVVACGSGSSGGGGVPVCQNPTASTLTCDECTEASCDTSQVASACSTYVACVKACPCDNTSCLTSCAEAAAASASCSTTLAAISSCTRLNCPSTCATGAP